MLIRRELPDDAAAIRAVHTAAFRRLDEPDGQPPEVDLVENLRASTAWIEQLSLVALVDAEVIGHVCCTRATVGPDRRAVLGLGPLGVHPGHQGRGVGHALMYAVLAAADALDEPLVGLLGEPSYYARFGFMPASHHGIEPPVAHWAPAFQARPLTAYDPGLRGVFRYAEPFNRL